MADLVIQNGTLVSARDTVRADLAIDGGKIVAIGEHLEGRQSIDATGLLVIPGGVDPHVHLQYPQGRHRVVSSDDWLTGTLAAAYGGTTTVLDFVEAGPDQTWLDAFEQRLAVAQPQAVVDFGFHMTFNRVGPDPRAAVCGAIQAGMPSFKIYMAYDGVRLTDAELLVALEALKAEGGLPIVHAEHHEVIMWLVARCLAEGKIEPRWHPSTRPAAAEVEATLRALTLAEIVGLPMHIVHVSAGAAALILHEFRKRGRPVSGEVAIQHLLLDDSLYQQPGFAPARYVMAPPLRSAADNEALWQHLRAGDLDFVVTDHCPFTLAQKAGRRRTPEFRRLPEGLVSAPAEVPWAEGLPPFSQLPGGAPGIETRLPLLYHFGVTQGRLPLSQFVELTSSAAARRFGLYPRKGALLPGADADIVLFDPRREVTLTASGLHQNCDYTPYEGWQVTGWPRTVFSRGEVIVRDGQFVGRAGRGEYLRR